MNSILKQQRESLLDQWIRARSSDKANILSEIMAIDEMLEMHAMTPKYVSGKQSKRE